MSPTTVEQEEDADKERGSEEAGYFPLPIWNQRHRPFLPIDIWTLIMNLNTNSSDLKYSTFDTANVNRQENVSTGVSYFQEVLFRFRWVR